MWVRCITRPRASRLGSKSSSDAAAITLARVASATGCRLPERTREAVVMETPARAATSAREVRRVPRPDIGIEARYPDRASFPPPGFTCRRQPLSHSDASQTHTTCRPGTHPGGGGNGRVGAGVSLLMSRKATEAAPDTDFFEDAACQGADTSVFFPVSDTYADEAKAICATCPVAEQCLEYAVATHQADGVWGGMTALERHRLVRRRQRVAREERAAREESARESAA